MNEFYKKFERGGKETFFFVEKNHNFMMKTVFLFFSSVITVTITKLYELRLIPGYSDEMRNDDFGQRNAGNRGGHAYGSRVVKTIIKYCCKCCRENFFTHLP